MNSNDTSERIKAIAKELFFGCGLQSVSMDDLAMLAGISKKTIYQNYKTKDALVHAVVRDQIQLQERLIGSCQSTTNEAIDEVIAWDTELFGTWTAIHHRFFNDLEKYYPGTWLEMERYSSKILNLTIDNLKWGQQDGLYRNDINIQLIAELRMHQIKSLLRSQFVSTQKLGTDRLAQEITMLHLRSITTEKGKALLDIYETEKYSTVKNIKYADARNSRQSQVEHRSVSQRHWI